MLSVKVHNIDQTIGYKSDCGVPVKVFDSPCRIIRTIEEEVQKSGHDGLTALLLDHVDCVVIGVRMKFDKDLSDDSDARFSRNIQ